MKRLKGKKEIEVLFKEGNSINVFPFRLIFLQNYETAIGVSVGKKNFRLAVHRNRIKRQMRASLKKYFWPILNESTNNYTLMLIYISKEKPDWNQMVDKIKIVSEKFKKRNL